MGRGLKSPPKPPHTKKKYPLVFLLFPWGRKGRKVEVITEREGEGIGESYATMQLDISPPREEAKEKGTEAIIAMATLR